MSPVSGSTERITVGVSNPLNLVDSFRTTPEYSNSPPAERPVWRRWPNKLPMFSLVSDSCFNSPLGETSNNGLPRSKPSGDPSKGTINRSPILVGSPIKPRVLSGSPPAALTRDRADARARVPEGVPSVLYSTSLPFPRGRAVTYKRPSNSMKLEKYE